MLKLSYASGDVVYFSPRHIVAMRREASLNRTRIYTIEFSADQWVQETPEQILAMPEMANIQYGGEPMVFKR